MTQYVAWYLLHLIMLARVKCIFCLVSSWWHVWPNITAHCASHIHLNVTYGMCCNGSTVVLCQCNYASIAPCICMCMQRHAWCGCNVWWLHCCTISPLHPSVFTVAPLHCCTVAPYHHCTPVSLLHCCTVAPYHHLFSLLHLALLHLITIAPCHHYTPLFSLLHRCTVAPYHHCTPLLSLLHCCTVAPLHCCTLSPLHPSVITVAPLHCCTLSPLHPSVITVAPYHHSVFTVAPLHCITFTPTWVLFSLLHHAPLY